MTLRDTRGKNVTRRVGDRLFDNSGNWLFEIRGDRIYETVGNLLCSKFESHDRKENY